MSDMKDPSLRLFGMNIQLIPKDANMGLRVDQSGRDYDHDDDVDDDYVDNDCDYECTSSSDDNSKQGENRAQLEKTSSKELKDTEPPRSKKGSNSTITEDATKSAFSDKECSSQDSHNKDVSDQTSSTNPQDQKPVLKKPDKIIPCPRCNSMTTKFCYFNNYNVNQPRHFCKDCQRYWTAGGTMRNVPVGAGRRKTKHSSASQHRNLVVPGASEWRSTYKPYGFVQENTNANSMFLDKGGNGVIPTSLPPQVPCFQAFSRPYTLSPVAWQTGFPVSFYTTGECNSQSRSTIHDDQPSTTFSPNSLTTRKHSRDGTMLFFGPSGTDSKHPAEEKKPENVRVVVPKTLRVSDPIEAANSSIWSTLQNKKSHHGNAPIAKGGFFGQFHGNVHHDRSHLPSAEASSMALELNPVAFSRSLTFHETAQ